MLISIAELEKAKEDYADRKGHLTAERLAACYYIELLEVAFTELSESMKNAKSTFETIQVILDRCQSMLDHETGCECSDCFELDEAIALVIEEIEDYA